MSVTNCEKDNFLRPRFRKLRAYAFDPSLSIQLDTILINHMNYKVTWEDLKPGPVGEYIEVVDYDPSSGCFYRPVDLNNDFVLAQDGLDPSESNPQFHQQMVYAVAMTTIRNFEHALGRKITWSQYRNSSGEFSQYVQRLRIYPHAIREANAYYSPQKKAVLFGYFDAAPDNASLMMPGCTVYTCLSHDIIAHEVTHALLDGMHRRYIEASDRDSLAFHEAFADIVALFQHFTFPEVLKDQIAKTGGDLKAQNLLGELAQEFGKAIGHYGSLRDAIGRYNKEKGIWEPHKPNPEEYQKVKEPHARGAILVATIFDAFINLYKRRIADLVRIATGGTGVLPAGSLHPDLVNRMANEASKTASHILKICIRALDYCPPLDISFGDYLRALITSDYDLVSDDDLGYRVAIIEAFQNRGIFPDKVKNMSVESLLCKVEDDSSKFESRFASLLDFFRRFKEKISYVTNRQEIYELTKVFIGGGDIGNLDSEKKKRYESKSEPIEGLHERINIKFLGENDANEFATLTGLILDNTNVDHLGIARSKNEKTSGMPMVEVHNLKLASRSGPNDDMVNQIVVTLTQKRGVVARKDNWGNTEIVGFFNPENPSAGYFKRRKEAKDEEYTYEKMSFPPSEGKLNEEGREKVLPEHWFIFRGGSTLIFDLDYSSDEDEVKLQYVIKKDINDEERMKRQYEMLFHQQDFSLNATYFGAPFGNLEAEPFAIIHKVL